MICSYLDLEKEAYIFKRENGDKTILQNLDVLDFMFPSPKNCKVIEHMGKPLAIDLLKWLIPVTV